MRFHCFGCGAGGSSINFVAKLFGLRPLEAVRKIDADFHLDLPINSPMTQTERREAQKRQQLQDTWTRFEEWRREMIRQLDNVFCVAHLALVNIETPEDLDKLTLAQTEAIRWQPWAEYTANVLSFGGTGKAMEIFRERGEVTERCDRILRGTPKKSSAA